MIAYLVAFHDVPHTMRVAKAWAEKNGYSVRMITEACEIKRKTVCVVPSMQVMKAALKSFAKDSVILLVESPWILSYYHKSLTLIDGHQVDDFRFNKTKFGPASIKIEDVGKITFEVLNKDDMMIQNFLGEAVPSASAYFQKILYQLPGEKRNKIKEIYYLWLDSDETPKELMRKLRELGKSKAYEVLLQWITEGDGQRVISGIREVLRRKRSGKTINYKAASKKLNLDAFDIKYTLQAIEKARDASGEDVDSKVFVNERSKRKA